MFEKQRIFLLLAPILISVSGINSHSANATPPPNTPNFCTRMICAEIFPDVVDGKLKLPQVTLHSEGEKSTIEANYREKGRVLISLEKKDLPFCRDRLGQAFVRTQGVISGTIYIEKSKRNFDEKCLSLEVRTISSSPSDELTAKVSNLWIIDEGPLGVRGDTDRLGFTILKRIELNQTK